MSDPGALAIRPYREADRDACLGLFDGNVPDFFHPGEREEYLAWLAEPGGPVIVMVEPDGKVAAAGGTALEPDGETGSLCWGIVRRDLHGRGIGRRLLRARLAVMAGDPRFRRVRLSTVATTTGFFEKLGFRTARIDADGHGPGVHAHEMTLTLTDAVRETLQAAIPEGPVQGTA